MDATCVGKLGDYFAMKYPPAADLDATAADLGIQKKQTQIEGSNAPADAQDAALDEENKDGEEV